MKSILVIIVGPVGVGKSTQITELEKYLKSRGQRVVTTYIKCNHGLSYILYRSLKIVGCREKVTYPGDVVRVLPTRAIVRRLFPLVSFLDALSTIGKFLSTVYLPYRFGYSVLIEEGLVMTLQTYLMSYPLMYGTSPRLLPFLPRLLNWTVKKKHLTIVIDAADKKLDRRRKSRNFRKDEVPEFVSLQRKGIKLLNLGNTVLIDTSNHTAQEVHKRIVETVERA
jgi:broad-specificity NMP kinase